MKGHLDSEMIREFESLSEEPRCELLRHARACAGCRDRLLAGDPTRIFALLAIEPLPSNALESLSVRVEGELDRASDRPAAPKRWQAIAAVAATLLLASFFGLYIRERAPLTATAERSAAALAESAQLLTLQEPPTSPEYPVPLRSVELLSSPGDAQVVDFSVGDYQVVMIIDKELDI